jgi:hypothetical protein
MSGNPTLPQGGKYLTPVEGNGGLPLGLQIFGKKQVDLLE